MGAATTEHGGCCRACKRSITGLVTVTLDDDGQRIGTYCTSCGQRVFDAGVLLDLVARYNELARRHFLYATEERADYAEACIEAGNGLLKAATDGLLMRRTAACVKVDRLTPAVVEWLATGERGASSEAIVSHLTGVPVGQHVDVPYDPDDLRRCVKLMWQCPELIEYMDEMATLTKQWARIAPHWRELVNTFLGELQERIAAGEQWKLPRTYAQLQARHGGE